MAYIRTEVLIETSEIFTIKRSRTFAREWCDDCGREVNMAPLAEAALLFGHDVDSINSMIENRNVHFACTPLEMPSICLRSLCLF